MRDPEPWVLLPDGLPTEAGPSLAAAPGGRDYPTVTLREAADLMGVKLHHLKKMLRSGGLPEASKEQRTEGWIWVIPFEELPVIAAREGWQPHDPWFSALDDGSVAFGDLDEDHFRDEDLDRAEIDLDRIEADLVLETAPVSVAPTSVAPVSVAPTSVAPPEADPNGAPSFADAIDVVLLDRLLGVQEQAVLAVADAERAEIDLEQAYADLARVHEELAAERSAARAADERYSQERVARAAAEARAQELARRVEREAALADGERLASADANGRTLTLERERTLATASMGWLARRRYRRLLRTWHEGVPVDQMS